MWAERGSTPKAKGSDQSKYFVSDVSQFQLSGVRQDRAYGMYEPVTSLSPGLVNYDVNVRSATIGVLTRVDCGHLHHPIRVGVPSTTEEGLPNVLTDERVVDIGGILDNFGGGEAGKPSCQIVWRV